MSPLDFFTDLVNPQLAFLPRALFVAVLSALVCAVVGTHVVLRGSAFLTDAVSHAVFPGVAIAFLLGGSVLIGGAVAGVVTAVLITVLGHGRVVKNDAAIGIVFVAAFALGLLIMSRSTSYSGSLESFLFGSISAVSTSDLPYLTLASVGVIVAVLALTRPFTMVTLDRESAQALGLPVFALEIVFNVLVTLAIVLSLNSVGNILVVALLIAPAATARLFTDSVRSMMMIAAAAGSLAALIGMWASWTWDAPVGACIVLACAGLFVAARLLAPRHGWLAERRQRSGEAGHPRLPRRGNAGLRTAASVAGMALIAASLTGVSPDAVAATQPDREVIKNQHVDATHLHWDNKLGLRVDTVVGADTIRRADDLILDLQPQTFDGRDVSKLTIPSSGPDLSFVGKPGQTFWNAPQTLYGDWKPVWVGIGAGDVPAGKIDPSTLALNLVKVEGPSWLEVYQASSWGTQRAFSSRDAKYRRFPVAEHMHGHFNWTFGAPGRYSVYVQAEGKNPSDGSTIKSNVTKVMWQVGETSAAQNPGKVGPESPRYVKDDGAAPTNPAPADPTPTAPAPTPSSPTTVPSRPHDPAPTRPGSDNTPGTPPGGGSAPRPAPECAGVISRGHVDMAIFPTGNGFEAKLIDESRGAPVARRPQDVTLHVNDALKVTVPRGFGQVAPEGSQIWMVPQVQNPAGLWSGFNTERIDYSKLSGPVQVSLASVQGPGHVVLFSEDITSGLKVYWNSRRSPAGSFALSAPSHVHQSIAFDKPGTYRLTVRYSAKTKGGQSVQADAPYTVRVGGASCSGSGSGAGGSADLPPAGIPAGDVPSIDSPAGGTLPSADAQGSSGDTITTSAVPDDGGAGNVVSSGVDTGSDVAGGAGVGGDVAGAGANDSAGSSLGAGGDAGLPANPLPGGDATPESDPATAAGPTSDAGSASDTGAGTTSDSAPGTQVVNAGDKPKSGVSTQSVALAGAGFLFLISAAAWAGGALRDRRNNLA